MLDWQLIMRDAFRALPKAGSKMEINREMIEMTTNNSISVKPKVRQIGVEECFMGILN